MNTKNSISKDQEIAEIQLHYHPKQKRNECISIRCSDEAHKAFKEVWNHNTISLKESFKVAYLNRANRLLGIMHLAEGGISETIVDVRLVIAIALKANSTAIILAHNHPSGRTDISHADTLLTKKVIQAATFFDIKVLDHIILSAESYLSMADDGLFDTFKKELQILDRNFSYLKKS